MSAFWQLAIAAVSSLLISQVWPADGLYSTAVLLPWAALLFSLAADRLGRALERPVKLGRAWPWLLATLVIVALQKDRFGWAAFDQVWLAALLLLALAALWRLMPALRRHLSLGPPGAVFFVLPLALYLLLQPYALERRQPDGDEPYYLLLTHSLAFDGDIDLANNYLDQDWRLFMQRAIEPQPGDPAGPDGEIFSRHNALLPLALTPAYRLAGRVGATALMALMTAATAWLMLRLARRRWPDEASGALLAWATLAFTPPLLLYSHQVWIEVPAALLALFALDRLDLLRDSGAGESRRRDAALLALALILLPLLKLRLLLVAGPLGLLALLHLGRRRAMALLGAFTVALGALLVHNYQRYGNPLKMYGAGEFELLTSPPADWLRGMVGMFYDCAFGLFASAPIWLLLLPGLLELARRRDRFLGLLAFLSAPYLAAVAPRMEWYGGWSPPFRYPLVFLPLFALAMVPLLARRPAGSRAAATALGTATVVTTLLFITVPGWTYNLADGASHLLHQAGLQLNADVARLFPSTVRAREATLWWLALTALLAPLALIDGRKWRRYAAPAGFAMLFAVVAAIPWLATQLPTRVIEAEDAWVKKTAGRLEPERWMPLRPSYRGGWRMVSQTGLQAPIIAGGERAILRLHVRRDTIGPHRLELFAGQTRVGGLEVERISDWRVFEFGPVDWPKGEKLVIVSPHRARRDDLGLLLDRIEIEWLPASRPEGNETNDQPRRNP